MQVAPNQVSPGEPFDCFYFVRNPFDNATYYVRAKIYDVRTSALLDTITLDQSSTNTRLFIKTVQAPPDPSGYGRNIVAIASVYTDSGFTTQADSYEEQEQYYLIKAVAPMLGGGGIDYRGLREMMQEVVAEGLGKLPPPEPAPEFPFDALFGAIGALTREVGRIPKEFDQPALVARLDAVLSAIEALPKPEKTDLSAITQAVNDALFDIAQLHGFIEAQLKAFVGQVGTAVAKENKVDIRAFGESLVAKVETAMNEFLGRQEMTIPMKALLQEKQPTPSPIDVSHLMNR